MIALIAIQWGDWRHSEKKKSEKLSFSVRLHHHLDIWTVKIKTAKPSPCVW
jgi:hypothetical protein